MKILFLTQYYPPETGAPQNRLHELALRLMAKGMDVHVLTAMPNYPKMEIMAEYRGKKYLAETIDGIPVHRTSIYVSTNRGIVSRLRNYFSFVWSSMTTGLSHIDKLYDYILCESPPLFLAFSAFRIANRTGAKLIFNVSDLWPESAEKLNIVTNKFLLSLAYRLEATAYKRAFVVTGQTQGICADISRRFPEVRTYWLPNGVDLALYDPGKQVQSDFRKQMGIAPTDFVLFYGGIIGLAQGLETILYAAERLRHLSHVKFVLLGEGPEKEKLLRMKKEMQLHNLYFSDGVGKKEMLGIISQIDASIIPLRKLDLFLGAIPSKIFEILAMQKPVLLGVDGEARKLFIEGGNAGLYFEPENSEDLAAKIAELVANRALCRQLGLNGRACVSHYFDRDLIATKFVEYIKS